MEFRQKFYRGVAGAELTAGFSMFALFLGVLFSGCRTQPNDEPVATATTEPVGRLDKSRFYTPANQILVPSGIQVELPGLRPQALALSPDGKLLVTAGKTHELVVIDPRAGKVLQHVPLPSEKNNDFNSNPVSENILEPDKEGQLSFTGLVFSPDGSRVYLANVDGSIKVFGVEKDGKVIGLFTLHLPAAGTPGRKAEIPAGLAVTPDGKLLITADAPGAGDLPTGPEPQQLNNLFGKVLRINPDGSIPPDNPFRGRRGVRPQIYAYGFRDAEGAALDSRTGALWISENGPRGGDELNLVRGGRNYGFPAISYGLDYQGHLLGTGKLQARGMEQPVYYWDPVIAPSGLAYYNGELFPQWRGNLLAGALRGLGVYRLVLKNGKVIQEEPLLSELRTRIRDVRVGPDGAVYVLTEQKALLKLTPG